MAASAPPTPIVRRAATAPLRPREPVRRDSLPTSPDPQIETLYAHPSAKVLSFNAVAPLTSRPLSRDGSSSVDEEPGTLPWSSRSERTIAVGPLRIYRTPNSVVFLNCGSVVRPIFQKSKCWCVEQASGKFVLEMRKPQYWRVEVPNTNSEDIQRMERLKEVFNEILLFEKTACPFQRNFTVALPPGAGTPVVYRPWRPRERPKSERHDLGEDHILLSPSQVSREVSPEPRAGPELLMVQRTRRPVEEIERPKEAQRDLVKVSELRNNIEKLVAVEDTQTASSHDSTTEVTTGKMVKSPAEAAARTQVIEEISAPPQKNEFLATVVHESMPETVLKPIPELEADEGYDTSGPADQNEPEHDSDDADDLNDTRAVASSSLIQPVRFPADGLQASPSIAAPPQLTLVTSPPSKRTRATSPLGRTVSNESSCSTLSESDSFHSVESWHSPITPLPLSPPPTKSTSPATFPFPHDNIEIPKRVSHSRDTSENTIIPRTLHDTPAASGPCLPSDFMDASYEESYRRSSLPHTPELIHDLNSEQFDQTTPGLPGSFTTYLAPPPQRLRARANTSSTPGRRALSPLPPASIIYSPKGRGRPRHLQTTRHLPTAIIQKTYEILVSPPSHLVKLMMEWAARIARDGLWGVAGDGYAYEDEGSGDWGIDLRGDYHDEHLDDYGIAIEPVPSQKKQKEKKSMRKRLGGSGGSWEVD